MDANVLGLEVGQLSEGADSLVGQIIDRHEHFYYADQLYADRNINAAQELMQDLNLDYLPLVDRDLRVVSVLKRT